MIALIITTDGNTRLIQLPDNIREYKEIRVEPNLNIWSSHMIPDFDPFDNSVESVTIPLVCGFIDDRNVKYGIFEEPHTEEAFFLCLVRE